MYRLRCCGTARAAAAFPDERTASIRCSQESRRESRPGCSQSSRRPRPWSRDKVFHRTRRAHDENECRRFSLRRESALQRDSRRPRWAVLRLPQGGCSRSWTGAAPKRERRAIAPQSRAPHAKLFFSRIPVLVRCRSFPEDVSIPQGASERFRDVRLVKVGQTVADTQKSFPLHSFRKVYFCLALPPTRR